MTSVATALKSPLAASEAGRAKSASRTTTGSGREADAAEESGDQHQDDDAEQRHRPGDPQPAEALVAALDPFAQPRRIADLRLESRPPAADEVEADVGLARRRSLFAGRRGRHGDGRARHLDLAPSGALRQLLDRLPVEVPRGEIERREVRRLAQRPVDLAHLLEPDGPVDVVDLAQAADDVADRDIAGGKPVVLADEHFLGIRAARLEALLEPDERLLRGLRAVPQTVEELGGERVLLGRVGDLGEDRGAAFARFELQQPVGGLVRAAAHLARVFDAMRNPPEILDENEPEDRRQRPELADPEGLRRLVALHERAQAAERDRAVQVRDIEPGQGHDRGDAAVARHVAWPAAAGRSGWEGRARPRGCSSRRCSDCPPAIRRPA